MVQYNAIYLLVHLKEAIEGRVHRNGDIVRLRERRNPLLRRRIEQEASMYDRTLVPDILGQIDGALQKVRRRALLPVGCRAGQNVAGKEARGLDLLDGAAGHGPSGGPTGES